MANTYTKVLRLVFGAENGKTVVLQFNNPKAGITQADIQNLMQMIITKNVILSKNGALTTIVDGGVVERTFTDLIP